MRLIIALAIFAVAFADGLEVAFSEPNVEPFRAPYCATSNLPYGEAPINTVKNEAYRNFFPMPVKVARPRTVLPNSPPLYDAPIPEGLKVHFLDVSSEILPEAVQFVNSEELPVPEDLAMPFFYNVLPHVNPVKIDLPNTLETQEESEKVGVSDVSEVKVVNVSLLQFSEDPDVKVPDHQRVRIDSSWLDFPVENVGISKPGKVFLNAMWRDKY